jgi:hypothetical protein
MGESSATMTADTSLAGHMQAQVQRSVVQEVAGGVMRALSGLLGGSVGRIVRDVAHTASNDLQSRALANVAYTEARRREAVVRAFGLVRPFFAWDAAAGRFVAK